MKTIIKLFFIFLSSTFQIHAQGLITPVVLESNQNNETTSTPTFGCGSYEYMKYINQKAPGYLNLSNELMQRIGHVISNQKYKKSPNDTFVISVVFHIVYNNSEEDIPDSVLHNQIEILNDCFRRTNSDTVNTRLEFLDIVGDTKIEFKLAGIDPNGAPTSGITRTYSSIEDFGGILPYSAAEIPEILAWIDDSLYYNYFRITQDSLGGKSAWDINQYLNVWIGDLRILEPKLGNFEELLFFGLSTPPFGHQNWPDSIFQILSAFEQGVLMHYVNVGANNPNTFPVPYNVYNGLVTTGKTLVHEVGHYLGLRHIWGDGDCTFDDYIHDTPKSNASSQFNCNLFLNTCVDTINGMDLPDMVENYMDYSSGACQNSFTIGQIELMRSVLETYRSELLEISMIENTFENNIQLYPNPTTGAINIELGSNFTDIQINVRNIEGKLIKQNHIINNQNISLEIIEGSQGIYLVEIISANERAIFKVVKQ